jgi:hypothetical protein
MEMVRNSSDIPNPPESGGGVVDSLMSFVSRKIFTKNTSDHDRQKCQQLANELRNRIRQLEHINAEQSRMAVAHKQEVSRLKEDIGRYAVQEARLQKEVSVLEVNNAKLHERCNKFDDNLRVVQEQSLRQVSNGRWLAQDDLNTYDTLRSLRDQIKSWAIKFSIKNLQELDSLHGEDRKEDLANLKSYLGSIFAGSTAEVAPADISSAKITSMMLTAVLAHEIHEKVLANPFFFLDGGVVQKSKPPGSVFLNVYNQLIRGWLQCTFFLLFFLSLSY